MSDKTDDPVIDENEEQVDELAEQAEVTEEHTVTEPEPDRISIVLAMIEDLGLSPGHCHDKIKKLEDKYVAMLAGKRQNELRAALAEIVELKERDQ